MSIANPIIIDRTFGLSPSVVWKALTDRDQLNEWYFSIPSLELIDEFVFSFYEPGVAHKFLHRCEILDVQPQFIFQHTWTYPSLSSGVSVVTWQILPRGNATQLRLKHEGIENFEELGSDFSWSNFEHGWRSIIDLNLGKFLGQKD